MSAEYRAPVWYWATLYAALGVLLVLFVVFLVLFVRSRSKAKKGGADGAALDAAAELLAEDYRFRRMSASAAKGLDPGDRAGYDAASSAHRGSVDEISARLGLDVVTYDGLTYDESWPVDPVNADEFTPGETLLVMQTTEPAVIDRKSGRVLRYGAVTLGRKAQR